MSATTESPWLTRVKWGGRKLVSLFIIYIAVGSLYQAGRAGSILALVLYAILGAVGVYLLMNW